MVSKILIIEDDEAIVSALRVMLESRGHDVRVAGDGDAGVLMLSEYAPDLLILDLYLPGRDGLELYRSIKSGEFEKLPVIVLSSLTKRQIMTEADREGDILPEDTVFSKPIDPSEFISKVEEMLAAGLV